MKNNNYRILILGSNGMVGKSLIHFMKKENINFISPNRKELDLKNYNKISNYFKKNKFDYVINCAAKVGGILENLNNQIIFYKENIEINNNLIKCAHEYKIKNFINLGSSCMYPGNYDKKMNENKIMSGPLESTNLGYGIAKITSSIYLKLVREETGYNYCTIIPCNLYGPNDNFIKNKSHLIASIINKVSEAKLYNKNYVKVWGDGKAKREFLYVDDLTIFITRLVKSKKILPAFMNVGYGNDFSVTQYYKKVMSIYNYKVDLKYDKDKPNGVRRKLIDSKIAKEKYGFKIKTKLESGIKKTINYYEKNKLQII